METGSETHRLCRKHGISCSLLSLQWGRQYLLANQWLWDYVLLLRNLCGHATQVCSNAEMYRKVFIVRLGFVGLYEMESTECY